MSGYIYEQPVQVTWKIPGAGSVTETVASRDQIPSVGMTARQFTPPAGGHYEVQRVRWTSDGRATVYVVAAGRD